MSGGRARKAPFAEWKMGVAMGPCDGKGCPNVATFRIWDNRKDGIPFAAVCADHVKRFLAYAQKRGAYP